jgi:hypothetical protein
MSKAEAPSIKRVVALRKWDRVFSTLHGKFVRFLDWDKSGLRAAVADSDTLEQLPDWVHWTQFRFPPKEGKA